MKSLKTLIFGATLTLGFVGSTAFADTLYTVQSGDTLSSISTSFIGNNGLIEQIAKDNNINDINLIIVGQELTIKTDGASNATETSAAVDETAVTNTDQSEDYRDNYQDVEQNDSSSSYVADSSSAKEWIAQKESSGSYSATNGQYIGRYQLTDSYLNGDYSAENQERVADQYVAERYGSWEAAQQFWMNNGWY